MPLPYPTKVVLPFDIATAQDMNERHANDVALADGTGLDDEAITERTLAPSAKPQFYAGNHTLSSGVNSVSGIGFQPRYVRFTANRMGTGSVDSFSFWSYGVAYDNGSSIIQKGFVSLANSSAHGTRRNENNALIGIDTSNTAVFVGSVTALSSGTITINVTTFNSLYSSWFIEAFA